MGQLIEPPAWAVTDARQELGSTATHDQIRERAWAIFGVEAWYDHHDIEPGSEGAPCIIDFLTMYPEARREVARTLGEIDSRQ